MAGSLILNHTAVRAWFLMISIMTSPSSYINHSNASAQYILRESTRCERCVVLTNSDSLKLLFVVHV